MIKIEVKVIAVKSYNFSDKDGKIIRGAHVHYLDCKESAPDAKGYIPIKQNIDYEMYDVFTVVPGLYEVDFGFKADSKGKAVPVWKFAELKEKSIILD